MTQDNIVLAMLQEIRTAVTKNAENSALLATSLAGLRRETERNFSQISDRIDSLHSAVTTLSIAVDGHHVRLTHAEARMDNLENPRVN